MSDSTIRRRPRRLAATAVTLLALAGLPALAPIPASAATPTPLSSSICGTWVLQQVSSVTELRNLRTQIDAALSLPGVVGLSLRFPWKPVDTNFTLLDEGLAYARAKGKAFSIRFMAGRHTPARVFDAGSPYYVLASGEKTPSPFYSNGSPNVVFEQAWDEFVGRLAGWSRANGVKLLHLSWYGQDWAELNHGKEVRSAPGYTQDNWLNSHKRLIEIGARHSGADLAVEAPLSGYGPLSNGQSAALADKVIASVGADSDRFFIQANGWGPNGDWGAPDATTETQFDQIWSKPVRRGEQAIQPQDYNWTTLYGHLYRNDATYAEVYLPSFSLASKALLASEIKKFSDSRCGAPAPADTTPPTAPSGLTAQRWRYSVQVCWNRSTDNAGVAGYRVSLNGVLRATTTSTCQLIDNLARNTSYTVAVRAFDAAGNVSAAGTIKVRTKR
jgi:hypothetical protein